MLALFNWIAVGAGKNPAAAHRPVDSVPARSIHSDKRLMRVKDDRHARFRMSSRGSESAGSRAIGTHVHATFAAGIDREICGGVQSCVSQVIKGAWIAAQSPIVLLGHSDDKRAACGWRRIDRKADAPLCHPRIRGGFSARRPGVADHPQHLFFLQIFRRMLAPDSE